MQIRLGNCNQSKFGSRESLCHRIHVVAATDWNYLVSGTQQSACKYPAQLTQTDDDRCFHVAGNVYSTPLV